MSAPWAMAKARLPTTQAGELRHALLGEKEPFWACEGCDQGRAANWACRVVCTCGRLAPIAVRRKALAAHTAAEEARQKAREEREQEWPRQPRGGKKPKLWKQLGLEAILADKQAKAKLQEEWPLL